jgi:hypothetical protein
MMNKRLILASSIVAGGLFIAIGLFFLSGVAGIQAGSTQFSKWIQPAGVGLTAPACGSSSPSAPTCSGGLAQVTLSWIGEDIAGGTYPVTCDSVQIKLNGSVIAASVGLPCSNGSFTLQPLQESTAYSYEILVYKLTACDDSGCYPYTYPAAEAEFGPPHVISTGTFSTPVCAPPNQAPSVSAGSGHSISGGSAHTHSGASASDPDSNLASYTWSWMNCPGACPSLSNASGSLSGGSASVPGPTYTPGREGNYTLRLKVLDSLGLGETSDVTDSASGVCGNGLQEGGEACDEGGNNGVCTATCSASCQLNSCKPDLTTELNDPGSVEEGKSISFSGTVRNIGTASSAFNVGRYCIGGSASQCLDLTDAQLASAGITRLDNFSILTMSTGGSASASNPSWVAAGLGSHTVHMCADVADPSKRIDESDESAASNCDSRTVTVTSAPVCSGGVDIGLRFRAGGKSYIIATKPNDSSSKLRVYHKSQIHSILLVDPGDANAGKMRIRVGGQTKAVCILNP